MYFEAKINQIASGLNRGLSSNFWCLRNANHLKFKKECVMCTEKYALIKNFYKRGKTLVCHYKPESIRKSMEWKHINFPLLVGWFFMAYQPLWVI